MRVGGTALGAALLWGATAAGIAAALLPLLLLATAPMVFHWLRRRFQLSSVCTAWQWSAHCGQLETRLSHT